MQTHHVNYLMLCRRACAASVLHWHGTTYWCPFSLRPAGKEASLSEAEQTVRLYPYFAQPAGGRTVGE
jgi:hypothetical protein